MIKVKIYYTIAIKDLESLKKSKNSSVSITCDVVQFFRSRFPFSVIFVRFKGPSFNTH